MGKRCSDIESETICRSVESSTNDYARVWVIERYPPVRVLIQRIVRLILIGHGLVIQRRILHVNCHTHSYARAEGFKSGSDRVPQRLSIGKESMCELAIDDGDTWRMDGVLLGEKTPLKQRYAHGPKITRPGKKRLQAWRSLQTC